MKVSDKTIREWATTQSQQEPKYKLDGIPGAPELLKRMLAAVQKEDEINWHSVARFVKQHFPKAPTKAFSYKNYAAKKLNWKE